MMKISIYYTNSKIYAWYYYEYIFANKLENIMILYYYYWCHRVPKFVLTWSLVYIHFTDTIVYKHSHYISDQAYQVPGTSPALTSRFPPPATFAQRPAFRHPLRSLTARFPPPAIRSVTRKNRLWRKRAGSPRFVVGANCRLVIAKSSTVHEENILDYRNKCSTLARANSVCLRCRALFGAYLLCCLCNVRVDCAVLCCACGTVVVLL